MKAAELTTPPTDAQRRQAATALLQRYDARLRRTARRYSLCAADAEDAYQRAIEILLRKAPVTEPERLVRWMHTVTRHEAYAVRRQREKLLDRPVGPPEDGPDVDPVDLLPHGGPEPTEGVARKERVVRSFEALKALKPQELRTLMLKAEGYSYAEIEEITGFSQTKINRCMVEGRRRFLETFAEIEEGRRCEALSPALSRFCDGELDSESRARLMEHLGQCAHCRAKLRAYRETPRRVLALAPAGIAAGPTLTDRFGERLALIGDRVRETAASLVHRGGGGALDASQTIAAGGGARGSGLAAVALDLRRRRGRRRSGDLRREGRASGSPRRRPSRARSRGPTGVPSDPGPGPGPGAGGGRSKSWRQAARAARHPHGGAGPRVRPTAVFRHQRVRHRRRRRGGRGIHLGRRSSVRIREIAGGFARS